MPAPKKYPEEMRERAIRLVFDVAGEAGNVAATCRRIGEELGINADTLRGWAFMSGHPEPHDPAKNAWVSMIKDAVMTGKVAVPYRDYMRRAELPAAS